MSDVLRPKRLNYASSYQSPDTGCFLYAVNNPNPTIQTKQEHIVALPILCPYSKNPDNGSELIISYQADKYFLEVFAIYDYVNSFIAHPIVRDIEFFTQTIARDCAKLLDVKVQVTGKYFLTGLNQKVITTVIY